MRRPLAKEGAGLPYVNRAADLARQNGLLSVPPLALAGRRRSACRVTSTRQRLTGRIQVDLPPGEAFRLFTPARGTGLGARSCLRLSGW